MSGKMAGLLLWPALLTACSPAANVDPQSQIEIHSVSVNGSGLVSYVLENKGSGDLCFSSTLVEEPWTPNPFWVSASDGKIHELSIFPSSEPLPHVGPIRLMAGKNVQLEAELGSGFAIEGATWAEFDIAIPVFPCDFELGSQVDRHYFREAKQMGEEDWYGVQDFYDAGLVIATSERVRIKIHDLCNETHECSVRFPPRR